MFTGIIEEIGRVIDIKRTGKSVKLRIGCDKVLEGLEPGHSISVNGICLTVSQLGESWIAADVMPETIDKTSLGSLGLGQMLNLERALRLSDRLGGHIVTGHIDGTGMVMGRETDENAVWIDIGVPEQLLRYIVLKGSVALDGASLTVADISSRDFRVSLIPHTRKITILGSKIKGDRVNVECDILGKYIERLLGTSTENDIGRSGITAELLQRNGFI